MKTTSIAILATLFLALSLALACGDDDGGSNGDDDALTAYFAGVERLFEETKEATTEAGERLNDVPSDAALDEQISALDTYLGEIDAIFNEATDSLENLGVPAAAADGHQDFIDGVRKSLDASNALRDDLTNIASDEQLDDRVAEFDSALDGAEDKSYAACLALQEIADAENISVDLNCED